MKPTVLEICAGAGGQSYGLEIGGLEHVAAIEVDPDACKTLRVNRPSWHVIQQDVREVDGRQFRGVDVLAGGVPCPPFSIAGKQLGKDDERDLFPEALRLTEEIRPRIVFLENVKGLGAPKFEAYRRDIFDRFSKLGYSVTSTILNAADFGVPQLRPRFLIVAAKSCEFAWPSPTQQRTTVGDALRDLMAAGGWRGAEKWAANASDIAPTLVGGSKKHGGPDLGPTRARLKWASLGVDGRGLAEAPPTRDFPSSGQPRLTVRMAARIQGFGDDWQFVGRKTAAYRQVGNAFPPPVAAAVAREVATALGQSSGGITTHSSASRSKPSLRASALS